MATDSPQAWERIKGSREPYRKGESRQAFEGFTHYRDLGPKRSIEAAFADHQARCIGHSEGIRRAGRRWYQWSMDWGWVERAAAWDAHLDDQRRDAIAQKAREEATRWETERTAIRDRELDAGKALLVKALEMLKFPLAEVRYVQSESGLIQQLVPARWTFGNVAQLLDTASKLMRLAAEMETSRGAINMEIVHRQAQKLADEYGLTVEEVLAEAERIIEESK